MIHVLAIVVFMAVLMRDAAPRAVLFDRLGPWWAAGLTLGAMAAILVVVQVVCVLASRGLERGGWRRWLTWSERITFWSRIAIVGVHVAGVFVLGWVDAVRRIIPGGFAADELIAASPAILAMIATWASWYPIERWARLQELLPDLDRGLPVYGPPTRGEYVLGMVRHHLAIVVAPIAVISIWGELIESAVRVMALDRTPRAVEFARIGGVAAQLAGVAAVFGLMPVVLRRVWDTVRLGGGDLRDRLMGVCDQHHVRVRELLVWRTHGTMVNAAVLGFLPRLRYILVTDSLLDRLPGSQVEAVMAHEIGHVRHHHMAWLAASLIGTAMLVGAAVWWLMGWLHMGGTAVYGDLASPVASLAAGLVVFGFVSRIFERQSDAFAARHLSGESSTITATAAMTMIEALESVARGNRVALARWTWRHGSIDGRMAHLRSLVGADVGGLAVDRRVTWVKAMVGAVAVTGVALVIVAV